MLAIDFAVGLQLGSAGEVGSGTTAETTHSATTLSSAGCEELLFTSGCIPSVCITSSGSNTETEACSLSLVALPYVVNIPLDIAGLPRVGKPVSVNPSVLSN